MNYLTALISSKTLPLETKAAVDEWLAANVGVTIHQLVVISPFNLLVLYTVAS